MGCEMMSQASLYMWCRESQDNCEICHGTFDPDYYGRKECAYDMMTQHSYEENRKMYKCKTYNTRLAYKAYGIFNVCERIPGCTKVLKRSKRNNRVMRTRCRGKVNPELFDCTCGANAGSFILGMNGGDLHIILSIFNVFQSILNYIFRLTCFSWI